MKKLILASCAFLLLISCQSIQTAKSVDFAERSIATEARQPLFSQDTPLNITIIAPFSGEELSPDAGEIDWIISGNEKFKEVPAKMLVFLPDGQSVELNIEIKLRGKDRVMHCQNKPLKVSFSKTDKSKQDQTEFRDLKGLKITTKCDRFKVGKKDDDYLFESTHSIEQEYLAYKVYQKVTEQSFGVRLAKITYIDSNKKDKTVVKTSFFIEHEKDLGKRLSLQTITEKTDKNLPSHYSQESQVHLFQIMIGNGDYSANFPESSNAVYYLSSEGKRVLVPYDFDRAISFGGAKYNVWMSDEIEHLSLANLKTDHYGLNTLKCLSDDDRKLKLNQFYKLAGKTADDLKNSKIFTLKEKTGMISYYKGFQKWIETSAAKQIENASCAE